MNNIISNINLKSFNSHSLKEAEFFFKKQTKLLDLNFKKKNIKKVIKRFTLLKSPHVYKKARDQYECVTYKNILQIKGSKVATLSLFRLIKNQIEKDVTYEITFEKN